ncbi:site-specific integrase [Sphingobium sp. WCS2017Hpa-17]|uniref:tyrosine-type recombinase/integrase n=1 Tax=Sphingobium sp. WCS2017Hpa-17 TaxID=3073638 RepID=UPI00288B6EAB|nr:site-specific integrase [Sphingobium sp. WCS2017Hpa-17]
MAGYIASLDRDDKASAPRRRDAWKAMKPFWEKTDPALIDPEMCRSYDRQRKAAPATIRYELLMVSTAVKWAKKPKPEMWLPPVADRKIRHLTHAQFEKFYDGVVAPHARLYVLLGLYTMARPKAILELTWDRIDFARGLIDLNPAGRRQTAKRRPVVTMNDELRAELVKAYEARQISHVIERGGQPIASIKKAFQAASERSGVQVTPYMLRHTGAVWAAENGISMAALAQFMGHDDDSTTQKHYARFSPGYLKGVANAVQRRPF